MKPFTLLLLVVGFLIGWFMPLTPALRIAVSPGVGFAPLKVQVRVRQDAERLRGYEICLRIAGPVDTESSCWQQDIPAALVTRDLKLGMPGAYELWAESRLGASNHVRVEVAENGQQP